VSQKLENPAPIRDECESGLVVANELA